MTEQPADGAAPVPTRAQRRRQKSWFARRRARRNARRRTKRMNARPEPAVEADPPTGELVVEERVVEELVLEEPAVEEEPAPEPEPESEPETETETEPPDSVARRSRRTRPRPNPKPKRTSARPNPNPNRTVGSSSRFWARTMPAIAGALAILVAIGVIVRAANEEPETRRPPARSSGTPAPGTLLLVHHRPQVGNDLIVLLGADRATGSALLIPVATQLDVPALGVATLGAIPVDDGGARLATGVENVVGIGIGHTVVLDDAGLTAILGPAAPIPVTLAGEVEILLPPVSYPVGEQDLSSAQATELLVGPQSVNELDRLVTAGTVIEAWLDRLRDPEIARRTAGLQTNLEALIAAAAAPDHRLDTLPVDSIAITGGERFAVREADVVAYVQRAFPRERLGTGQGRPRVEVLNGTGFLGVAQAVAEKVVPAGGKITLTENVRGFGQNSTEIVYYQDEWRDSAQRLLDAMGCGSLRKARKDLGISDVTIVVGADCPQYGAPEGNS